MLEINVALSLVDSDFSVVGSNISVVDSVAGTILSVVDSALSVFDSLKKQARKSLIFIFFYRHTSLQFMGYQNNS